MADRGTHDLTELAPVDLVDEAQTWPVHDSQDVGAAAPRSPYAATW